MKRWIVIPLAVIAAVTLAAGMNGRQTQTLLITGSSTIAPLATAAGEAFERRHSGVHVDVQTGGSSRGVADVEKGLSQLGMVSRALKPSEAHLTAHTFALDGIAMVVHESNRIDGLDDEMVRGIYTRKVTNWRELGGEDREIVVVHKSEGRSTFELFVEHFKLEPRAIRPHVVIGDNEQGIKTVAGNAGAVAYVSIGAIEARGRATSHVRAVPLSGKQPTSIALARGEYHFSRPLNFVVKGTPQNLAQEYLDFLKSPEGRALIGSLGFVAL